MTLEEEFKLAAKKSNDSWKSDFLWGGDPIELAEFLKNRSEACRLGELLDKKETKS